MGGGGGFYRKCTYYPTIHKCVLLDDLKSFKNMFKLTQVALQLLYFLKNDYFHVLFQCLKTYFNEAFIKFPNFSKKCIGLSIMFFVAILLKCFRY